MLKSSCPLLSPGSNACGVAALQSEIPAVYSVAQETSCLKVCPRDKMDFDRWKNSRGISEESMQNGAAIAQHLRWGRVRISHSRYMRKGCTMCRVCPW